MADDEEDDYMSASILDAASSIDSKLKQKKAESYSEKRKREIELGRQKGTVKSLREREKEVREAGLKETVLKEENKGFQLLAKMGFKKGMALGKELSSEDNNGETSTMTPRLVEPIPIIMKTGKSGLRATASTFKPPTTDTISPDSDESLSEDENGVPKKRAKTSATTERDFRESVTKRLEQRRTVGELYRSRRTLQSLDEAKGTERHALWIPETRVPEVGERGGAGVLEELGGGEEAESGVIVEEEDGLEEEEGGVEEDDKGFEGLEPEQQLREVVRYLRSEHFYCLWCGDRFKDQEEMAQFCPGEWRDDHDED
ncbi:G patch domain-containing protein 11 [Dinochytrium kinnereticum]|nr:G patch domain-containing protein 11 [Dinochytrium kinnereticum]